MLRAEPTATIRLAEQMQFRTLDGRPMVLNQAILAFAAVNERMLIEKRFTVERVAEIMRAIA
jgi:hypothetical protein